MAVTPLGGLRVLQVGNGIEVAYCTKILARRRRGRGLCRAPGGPRSAAPQCHRSRPRRPFEPAVRVPALHQARHQRARNRSVRPSRPRRRGRHRPARGRMGVAAPALPSSECGGHLALRDGGPVGLSSRVRPHLAGCFGGYGAAGGAGPSAPDGRRGSQPLVRGFRGGREPARGARQAPRDRRRRADRRVDAGDDPPRARHASGDVQLDGRATLPDEPGRACARHRADCGRLGRVLCHHRAAMARLLRADRQTRMAAGRVPVHRSGAQAARRSAPRPYPRLDPAADHRRDRGDRLR